MPSNLKGDLQLSRNQMLDIFVANYNFQSSKKMEILEWVKKQTGKLADNVKDYKFYVKNEPNFIDSSTTLILTPYTNRDQISTVPCVYKWSRIKNGLLNEVPEFRGNSFICEPSDIGCIIQAEVTSTDGAHPGTAVLKFGPVKLDVLIKKQVEHALTSGSAVMNVDLVQKDEIKQCQVKVTEETIKISHCNSNQQYIFDYTLGEPRIEASLKEPTKVQIFFNQKYESEVVKFTNSLFGFQDLSASMKQSNEKRLELKFSNRALKDNFLLIVKGFNTKKAMKTSAIIGKLENVDLSGNENFNYILEIESLRADLIKLARLNDKYYADKRMYYEEARKLEKEIEEIIVTYTKIAEGKCKDQTELDQTVMELREKRDEVMERKLHSLIMQNQDLKERLVFTGEEMNSNPQIIGQGLSRSNSGKQGQMVSSRGGFIKKRTFTVESPVNAFDNILQNDNFLEDKQPPLYDDKKMLAKQLDKSVIKIAQLQQQIKQLKNQRKFKTQIDPSQNYHVEIWTQQNMRKKDAEQKSFFIPPDVKVNTSSFFQNQKHNVTTVMDLNNTRKHKFDMELENLQKNYQKPKGQNFILKDQISVVSSRTEHLKAMNEDNRSQRSKVSANQSEHQAGSVTDEITKSFRLKIDQLTKENQKLKQEVKRLAIEKEIIEKQKSTLEAKYKKRLHDISSENSMYKRNQDVLNRSHSYTVEMEELNDEKIKTLNQQIETLTRQNLNSINLYNKAKKELEQVTKLRQENLKLKETIAELSARLRGETSLLKSEDQSMVQNN